MTTSQSDHNDMLVIGKSREVQRGMLAKLRGDREDAACHLLASAHKEFVLAKIMRML